MEADGRGLQGSPEEWEDDALAMVVSSDGLVAWVPAQAAALAQSGGRDALAAALRQGAWVPAEAAARTGWVPSPGMLVVEGGYGVEEALQCRWIRRRSVGQAAPPFNLPFLYLSDEEAAAMKGLHRDHSSGTPMPLFFFVPTGLLGYSLRAVDVGGRVARPVLTFNRSPNHDTPKVHGSCAGILLLSFGDRLYACNPCTLRWARLPPLHVAHHIVGFCASATTTAPPGDFGCKVLYHERDRPDSGCSYWIFTLGSTAAPPRCIGRPGPVELDPVLAAGIASSYALSPILFRGFLHWLPKGAAHDILRFDTLAETFSMIPPPTVPGAPLVGCQQLFEVDQHLAMTVKSPGTAAVDVWVRSNLTELWSRLYRIRLPVDAIDRSGTPHGLVNVFAVAQDRNALVCCARTLLQCDAMGAVLQSYQLGDHITVLTGGQGHTIQDSLLLHPDILPLSGRDAVDGEPPFLQNQ